MPAGAERIPGVMTKKQPSLAHPAATADEKRHAAKALRSLRKDYPEARCSLTFESPLDLLIATILSAQCTDKRVNLVTKNLFEKYRTAADYAQVSHAVFEREIKSTGFFRNKAKNIIACCTAIMEKYDGDVPVELDRLVELPGIGRKTANVVLGTAFGIASGIVVDTHVSRVSRRVGLSHRKDPEKIERDLMAVIPRKEWVAFSHRMIQHGRRVCDARRPKCDECSLECFCPKNGVKVNGK